MTPGLYVALADGAVETGPRIVEAFVAMVAARCDIEGLVVVGLRAYEVGPSRGRWLHRLTVALAPAEGRAPTGRGSLARIITRATLEAMREEVGRA
jgi:hypothetical protein